MDYPKASTLNQTAGQGLGPAVEREGPQLISRLENQLHGLVELRSRLRSVNRKLRGSDAETGNKPSDAPKPVETNLCQVAREIELLLEQCHAETGEIQALLS